MMTAVSKTTKEVVVAKGANGRDEYSCPDCQQPVYPRHRAKWTDHFVHKRYSVCKTKLVASLESDEHKLGKQLIVDWLKKNRDSTVEIVTEKTITTIDGRCRKIDVAVIKDDKVIEAHECQLSPICVDTKGDGLLDRIIDYHRLGISVTWWLGKRSESNTIRDFFESISPGSFTEYGELLRVETEDKKIGFYLSGYPIKYPNIKPQKMTKDTEEDKDNLQSKSQVVSKLVARFFKRCAITSNSGRAKKFRRNTLGYL